MPAGRPRKELSRVSSRASSSVPTQTVARSSRDDRATPAQSQSMAPPAAAAAAVASTSQARPSQSTQGMRYEPYSNTKEKRELRNEYRKLLDEQKEARSNISDLRPERLTQILQKSTQLFERVTAPSESVLDSRLLLGTAEMGAAMAKSMKIGSEFDVDDFLTRCVKLIGGKLLSQNELDREDVSMRDPEVWRWDLLGRKAVRRSRRAVTTDHLLGPLEVSYNKRTVTRRGAVDTSGPVVKPVLMRTDEVAVSANETTAQVSQINRRLMQVGGSEGVNLFKFVINPHSFSDTVENLFYVSFLIRDGLAALDTENEAGEPLLLSCESATQEDHENGVRRRQIILELDMPVWRQLIEEYDIRTSMIESRKPDQTASTDTWQRTEAA